ncbi:hypothetical protein [Pyruvatibacter mobilis]|uniref:hypothetical protein n=1 Tax=Pyruvatibacter mobilis TaxID=1712261 RepID=UPI003C79E558
MSDYDREAASHWHLDKRVPIALIVAMAVQTAGALVWAGAAMQRIDYLERDVSATSRIGERTARVEEQMRYLRQSVDRIETKLDRLTGK